MNKVEVLQHTDLFYNLTPPQLQLIASITQERRVVQGEVVFEEGSRSREVYVIVNGSVTVSHSRPSGSEVVPEANQPAAIREMEQVNLATLMAGQSFGEIAFVDGAVREATVRCASEVADLLVIDPQQLMAQCEANPELGFFIIRNIAKDLALIIRELDLHILGGIYWQMPTTATDSAGQA